MFSAIASIAGPILGASMMSDASQSAADTQARATQAGIDEQGRQFDLTRQDTAPYRTVGAGGMDALRQMLGLTLKTTPVAPAEALRAKDEWIADNYPNGQGIGALSGLSPDAGYADYVAQYNKRNAGQPTTQTTATLDTANSPLMRKFSVADFWNDPVVQLGYQAGLDLGTKALKNAAPLTTGVDSGAAAKELVKFGTDYTGMKAGDSYGRFTTDQANQFNKLAALAGIGQTAVGTATSAGANTANNVSNLLTSQGNANAAAKIAGANAWGGGLQSISNWWQGQNTLDKILNSRVNNNGYFGSFGPYNQSQAVLNSSMYGY